MSNGAVTDRSRCVTGLDNIGYVYGTSSTLFNAILLEYDSYVNIPAILENFVSDIANRVGRSNVDISNLVNPFYGYNPNSNKMNPWQDAETLSLVDGGEDNENIPLHPLIQPFRAVDVIFAIDSSADTEFNWPNGTSLVATYERSLNVTIANHSKYLTFSPLG